VNSDRMRVRSFTFEHMVHLQFCDHFPRCDRAVVVLGRSLNFRDGDDLPDKNETRLFAQTIEVKCWNECSFAGQQSQECC